MIKENVNGFNMLVTNGDEKDVSTKDKYCSHLWIHNNILNKNHTSLKYDIGRFMTESEGIVRILLIQTIEEEIKERGDYYDGCYDELLDSLNKEYTT